ncbi:uncharacterized protein EDB91DRAFT_1109657 [Suillus paluster]|uniref:uncharacterized protein n=1 Tax=Suillus paluster TaxID=48578 RepID=UPI001B865FDC|nr:uncharacterized protein EDB91DRAFT_1109657 [Suillus paluster]KAG1749782.1 hypothetical protein EDB91DRAFT_1109657 [Suillus paluster]
MTSSYSATVFVPDFVTSNHLLQVNNNNNNFGQPYPFFDLMQSPSPPPHSTASPQSQSPPPDTAVSRSSITSNSDLYNCQWVDCTSTFTDPEVLYNHLCNDHIGRKSTNNLCLTCKWKDCGTSCAKRDHITSHLRVHTPLKPHVCEICKKSFKRPQDLKKHEKIHTEEHHAQHKHSKAITVNDPAYTSRVRGDIVPSKGALNRSLSGKLQGAAPTLPHKVPFARARPRSSIAADGGHYSALPTPSPELESIAHPSRHVPHSSYELFLHNQVPSWDGAKPDARASNRNKRSLEYNVDDFFTEMKKRKVNPSYDTQMMERLNSIAYAQDGAHYDEFNPRSVSFDVRTPEELAAVNEFLVTLGRDVTAPNNRGSQDLSGRFSPTSYFDTDSLSQLGLTGMPGLLGPGTAYAHDAAYAQAAHPSQQYASTGYPSPPSLGRSSHPSVQQNQYNPVYPPMHASNPGGYSEHYTSSHRVSAPPSHDFALNTPSSAYGYHSTSTPQGHFHPTPPLDPTSPHSSSSTPSNATPPHHSSIQDSFADLSSLRGPRGAAPPVQMAAPEYHHKAMRTMIPLKTAPGNAPEPVAPKPPTTTHRGSINALLSPMPPSVASSSKLYPLLLPGDSDLKLPSLKPDAGPFRLPPLKDMYRSPSPSAPRSPDTSRGTTPSSTRSSPVSTHTTIPSLRSITETSESDELVKKVGKIQLDHLTKEVTPEDRRKHAELIRNLLVKINEDYRKRFGVPQVESSGVSRTSVDVEMAAA